jgi:polar amino acid transport system permease protein
MPPFDLLPPLLSGLVVTLQLFAGGCLVASVVALLAGLGRLSKNRGIRAVATGYVEFFRGTSALVQLYWFYFALPLLGIDLGAMVCGILVLGLNTGSYGAEVVRGAILAVPRVQREAALALNLSPFQRLRFVTLPQALLAILPPANNLLIELLKNTSLASLITISEMTFEGQILRSGTLRTAEIFGLLLVLYFLVASSVTVFMRGLERRLAIGRDHGGVR